MDKLSALQRDSLVIVNGVGPCKGMKIKEALEERCSTTLNPGSFYPTMDKLVSMGFVYKGKVDGRTNCYEITEEGRAEVTRHLQWKKNASEQKGHSRP